MKKILLLSIILFALSLTACNKAKLVPADAENPPELKIEKIQFVEMTKSEFESKLEDLSLGLKVYHDDMKETTYYSCNIDFDAVPPFYVVPYVKIDKQAILN